METAQYLSAQVFASLEGSAEIRFDLHDHKAIQVRESAVRIEMPDFLPAEANPMAH